MTIIADKVCDAITADAGPVSGDVPRVTARVGEVPHYQDSLVAAQSVASDIDVVPMSAVDSRTCRAHGPMLREPHVRVLTF